MVIHDSGFTHYWLRRPQHNGSHPELHSAAVVTRVQSTLTCFVLLDPHVHLYSGPISSTSTHPDLTLLHAEHDPLQHPRRVAPPHPAFEASSFVHVQDEPARHAESFTTVARPKLQLVFTDVDDRYEPMSLLGTRLYENRVPIDGLVNPHPELTSPITMSRYRLSYLAASLSYRNPDSATGARYLLLEHGPGLGAAPTWPPPD
ncbi:uncharacterized protein NECHADRAFT_83527 [Fusarium vanettenii 77-13-4]|uniref:Uncharacterized protein n=1 Tax=Fusarium vanettenii (strain ATCC MYA-4622 / CBS 123669 / FGSC 9596 / NRRL 45880 / 77-13-4) TaxID=660122 RepID=C7Z495_FUSV7|nr:uncharacterized protein NECHADRAFT_83527 [Fusarium vanettenii 77-13-4]EEU41275.1 predicted protein [Fusarium vanettenii 77-13-4]